MVAREIAFRTGVASDAVSLTGLYLRSRRTAMPWVPSVHDEAETLWWMRQIVLARLDVTVAHDSDRLLGFAALDGQWLDQLYVDTDAQGSGVGRALFAAVKEARPDGFCLRVFTRNTRARRFYEALGSVLVGQSDGSRNEENEPDCTYSCGPAALPTGMRPHPDSNSRREEGN
jgi:putative acetyltransferase